MTDPNGRPFDREHELEYARLALDSAWDSVIMHRPDGTIVYFNKAAADQVGLSKQEFAQLPPFGWSGLVDERVRAERLEALERERELTFISHGHRRDGAEYFVDVASKWVDTDEGPLIVSVSRDITERMHAQDLLREMAFHDPLTGLPNRALLDDRLEVAISEARRHEDLLGVAFIDIDNFKPVNDTHGHETGDKVLEALGHRLIKSVRSHDTIARMGGDEFVAVFTRLDGRDSLESAARKVLDVVRRPIGVRGRTITLDASCGLALFDPATDDARSLLMKADLAMYESKRRGRVVFRSAIDSGWGGP